jgi:uncharacterized protein YukJ
MPIPDYSVLVGHPTAGGLVWPHAHGKPPHYLVKVQAGSTTYQAAVNVQSQDHSEVLYFIDFQFRPAQEEALRALSPGLTPLQSGPGGLALDFLRQGLVRRQDTQLLPRPSLGHGAQLLAAVETLVNSAHQDGAVFLFLPGLQRWVAILLAFQTQSWTTDADGDPADALVEAAPAAFAAPAAPAESGPLVPRLFAAVRPTLQRPSASRPAGRGNQYFHPLPAPTRPAPYRMDLAEAVPPEQLAHVRAGRLVFHMVGDTGNAGHDLDYQMITAKHMERQLAPANPGDRPSFLYLLGDVAYFHGEEAQYASQFFDIYDYYQAPIFAIPGNHDGDNLPGDTSLGAFVKNFCAPAPDHPPAALEAVRDAMTQPNPYWTLATPLLTIIGLYTNVPEHGLLDDPKGPGRAQEEWFRRELAAAPADRPVIVTLHHPPYSLDRGRRQRAHGGGAGGGDGGDRPRAGGGLHGPRPQLSALHPTAGRPADPARGGGLRRLPQLPPDAGGLPVPLPDALARRDAGELPSDALGVPTHHGHGGSPDGGILHRPAARRARGRADGVTRPLRPRLEAEPLGERRHHPPRGRGRPGGHRLSTRPGPPSLSPQNRRGGPGIS